MDKTLELKNNVSKEVTLKHLLVLAFPMMVSQTAETVMMFTDRIFLSGFGENYISAAMSGGLTSFVCSSLFIGIIGYVNVLAAQYYGANQTKNCRNVLGQGLWLSIIAYPLAILFIFPMETFFSWMGHNQELLGLEISYFSLLMLGSVFQFTRNAFGGYFIGTGKTSIVMTANIIGAFINIPVNYVLIFGHLGFPAMGIYGAALGTIIGSVAINLVLLIFFIVTEKEKTLAFLKPKWDLIRKFIRFGGPNGLEMFINVFIFNFFYQLMLSYSSQIGAAVTITFNFDMLAFIPMLGLGIGVTAMVGQQMGAGNPEGAKKASYLGLKVAYVYGAVMAILFITRTDFLVGLFAGGLDQTDPTVQNYATAFLRLASIYTLADATQVMLSGALRGAGDTRAVMIISMSLTVFMGFMSYMMIKVWERPAMELWIFFIGFVVALGVGMFIRFKQGKWMSIKMIDDQVIPENA